MANTIPFIGSKISLISKARIRYEGILNEINTKESTVSLEQVRVFGTEGRAKEGEEISASDNVYEFIVFRGADILDISVKEGPSHQPKTGAIQDPAILSMPAKPNTTSEATPAPKLPLSSQSQPPVRNPVAQTSAPSTLKTPHATVFPEKNSTQRTSATKDLPSTAFPKVEKSTSGLPNAAAPANVQSKVAIGGEKKLPIYYHADGTLDSRDNRKPARVFDQREERTTSYRQYRNDGRQSQYGNYAHTNNGFYGRSNPINRDVYVPRSDFDIQSSNAKFEKEKTVEEIVPEMQSMSVSDNLQNIHTSTFYDKSSSFFDNISCDAKELADRKDHRQRIYEEKKLNVETFGRPAPFQYRRGGYQRGDGGGGYYRGGYRSRGNGAYQGYSNRMGAGGYSNRSSTLEQKKD